MKKNLIPLLIACAFIMPIAFSISCDSDEIFELNDQPLPKASKVTRTASIDMSKYLELSTYNPEEWNSEDYIIVGQATDRIGVTFSEEKYSYEFNASSGEDINISDSLYNTITSMFMHTNKLMNPNSSRKISRTKNATGDVSLSLIDCVPRAVSHMGVNPPTYNEAVAKCDELFSYWRQCGVYRNDVERLIEQYAPVTRYHNMALWTATTGTLCNLVAVFEHANHGGHHAVNATSYLRTGYSVIIYYHDYTSSGNGSSSILEGQLTDIYNFYDTDYYSL